MYCTCGYCFDCSGGYEESPDFAYVRFTVDERDAASVFLAGLAIEIPADAAFVWAPAGIVKLAGFAGLSRAG